MKLYSLVVLLSITFLVGVMAGANTQPIISGQGNGFLYFVTNATRGFLTMDASGNLTVSSGGGAGIVNLNPRSTGYVYIQGANNPQLLLDNGAVIAQKSIAGTVRNLLTHYTDDQVYLDNPDGSVLVRPSGSTAGAFSSTGLAVTGDVDTTGAYRKGGLTTSGTITLLGTGAGSITVAGGIVTAFSNATAGFTGTFTVRNAAGTGTCTMTFNNGMLSAESC